MQLECSDESRACWVGLQSTPSSVIRATVEGREILGAANGFSAVQDIGDTCVITTPPDIQSEQPILGRRHLLSHDRKLRRRRLRRLQSR